MENIYAKLDSSVNMPELIRSYLASLRSSLDDAKTQAENGSELGMAVAVGSAYSELDKLDAAFNAILAK